MSKEAIVSILTEANIAPSAGRWGHTYHRWEVEWEVPVESLMQECDRLKVALLKLHDERLLELEDRKIFRTESGGKGYVIAYLNLW